MNGQRRYDMDTRRSLKLVTLEGLDAQRKGTKWWDNPYPAGGKLAYAWDQGHTIGRKRS